MYYEKEIHHSRLYPNLDTLVEKGLVNQKTGELTTMQCLGENNMRLTPAETGSNSTLNSPEVYV
jgi:hypothetical protein